MRKALVEPARPMNEPSLVRLVFKTSRLAEFCSQKELVNQTGHAVEDWPLVILKELVDNALDAAEESSIAPVINITDTQTGIIVTDNGPSIAPETIDAILDYNIRASSREAYVSPTRGAQGNALKTIIPMGFALDGTCGETVIESRGVSHRIEFSIDPVRQIPNLDHSQNPGLVQNGTSVEIRWPDSASEILDAAKGRFIRVATDFGWLNPHLTLTLKWDRQTVEGDDDSGDENGSGSESDEDTVEDESFNYSNAASNPTWRKWLPSDPTSPHWYDAERLGRLIGAHIAHAEDHEQPCPTVREFISEFRGLARTATQKAICDLHGVSRQLLADFYKNGNRHKSVPGHV